MPMDQKPVIVPEAKQAGEAPEKWTWVEPSVWTGRMLEALDKGVKGGKWFSLIDKVHRRRTLDAAFARVAANDGAAGVDRQTIKGFERLLSRNLEKLSREIQSGSYQPQSVRRVWIDKLGSKEKRPLGIPTVRDRVAQTALRSVIEPIFEKDFAEQSFGFRPDRGCKDALRRVDALLKLGFRYVVDADLKSYFDTIPHEPLMTLVEKKISDGRVLALLRAYLQQGVFDDGVEWTPERGSPQGAAISPLLSNIYLDPLDHLMADANYQMVRYADDFVILCRTREEAEAALEKAQEWTLQAQLTLHPEKTRIVDAVTEGFVFLGYEFRGGYRFVRQKSIAKIKETIRGKTKRCHGHSLERIIEEVNRSLRGWFEYYKHAHRTTFRPLDAWIRMRLRSILRKRQNRKGRGRGADHQRWPNAYFAEHGLTSLVAAHAAACQASH